MLKLQTIRFSLMLLALMFILSSCTANTKGKDEHGFTPHLTVDLRVPPNIALQNKIPFIIEVKKGGIPFEHAEEAVFSLWPENHQDQAVTIPARESSPGIYQAEHTFSAEGIYILQSHVSSANLEVMPSKRIAIGPEAIEKLALLEQSAGKPAVAASAGAHH